jgi:type IV secretion system protein VirD4
MSDVLKGFFSGVVFIVTTCAAILALMSGVLKAGFKYLFRPKTFGRAQTASNWRLRRRGYFGGNGLIIGRKRRWLLFRSLIRFNHDGHAFVLAPSGSGKGRDFVLPNLLDYRGSVICNDPKGENFDVTSRQRRSFGKVFRLDLIEPELSDCFNPLDTIRMETTHAADDAELIASLLVKTDAKGDDHWTDSARNVLKAVLLFLKETGAPHQQTLLEARRLLVELSTAEGRGKHAVAMRTSRFESVRDLLTDLENTPENELGSILSSARKAMKIWSYDSALARFVTQSDFTFEQFKDETCTLYLMLPPDKLATYEPLVRLVLGLAPKVFARYAKKPKQPVMMLMDELGQLGRIATLPQDVALLRGVGVRFVQVWHSTEAIKAIYGQDAEQLRKVNTLQVFFSLSDEAIAQQLSTRMGNVTVRTRTFGETGEVADMVKAGRSLSHGEAGRPLMYPAEIMESPDVFAVVPEMPVIQCKRANFTKIWRWRGRWDKRRTDGVVQLFPPRPEAEQPPLISSQ